MLFVVDANTLTNVTYNRLKALHISQTTQDNQLSTKHCNWKMNYWK